MGARIATRLVWEGFNPQVYDIVDIAVRMFTNDVGGMMSGSPKMMAQSCDVIITVLPSADALRDVLYGWEGLAGGFTPGGVVIDMGTSDPMATVDLAKQLADERGIDLIDAPALGTPADARAGKLTFVIGGDRCRGGTLPADLRGAGRAHAACRAGGIGTGWRGAWRLFARCGDPCRQRGAAIGQRFGLDAKSVVDIGEMLSGVGPAMGALLREQVLTRRFDTGLALGHVLKGLEVTDKSGAIHWCACAAVGSVSCRLGCGRGTTRIGRGSERTDPVAGSVVGARAEERGLSVRRGDTQSADQLKLLDLRCIAGRSTQGAAAST